MSPPQEPLADPITELRRLTDALLDRLQPWLSSLDAPREQPVTPNGDSGPDPTPPPSQGRCPCPLCVLQTSVHGDRTELARHLTTHGLTALAALRELFLHHPGHQDDPTHHHDHRSAAVNPDSDDVPPPPPSEQATPTTSTAVPGGLSTPHSLTDPQEHRIPVRRPTGVDTRMFE